MKLAGNHAHDAGGVVEYRQCPDYGASVARPLQPFTAMCAVTVLWLSAAGAARADYAATIERWWDHGYAPGKLSMPPTGNGRIEDWHKRWPGHPDMHLSPASCSRVGQVLKIMCTTTSCGGGFRCRADLSCPDGAEPDAKGMCPRKPPQAKQRGRRGCSETAGNPCNAATGNKYQRETDLGPDGVVPGVIRAYNSAAVAVDMGLGAGWTAGFLRRLEISEGAVTIVEGDGRAERWQRTADDLQGPADTDVLLEQVADGFQLSRGSGAVEHYDLAGRPVSDADRAGRETRYAYDRDGRLTTVTGPFGHRLALDYGEGDHIAAITGPAGRRYAYGYDDAGNLVTVTYPDGAVRRYHYEDTDFPHHLTGLTDGNGNRYAAWAYDSAGRAVRSQHAQTTNGTAQQPWQLAYDTASQTTVTGPDGRVEILTFAENLGVKRLVSRLLASDGKGLRQQFDARNNFLSRTDAAGRRTAYTWNESNQLVTVTEVAGTPAARTTTFEYLSPAFDLPTRLIRDSILAGEHRERRITYNPPTCHTHSPPTRASTPTASASPAPLP